MPRICQWFALCERPAVTTQAHPILAPVPICQACLDRLAIIDKN